MASTNPGTALVAKIVLPVNNMEEATAFYRMLGFEVEGDGGYGWVTHRGEEILHLSHRSDLDRQANRAGGYFHVQDAADWHRAWSEAGVNVEPIQDQPWQMREFAVKDPSGNLLRVGQNL